MIYQLFFITVFVGVFSCLASACAAQTIKFRSVDHLLCSICGLLFVIGIAYPAFSNPMQIILKRKRSKPKLCKIVNNSERKNDY